MEYLLLTFSDWALDGDWFGYLSGWHLLVVGGLVLLIAVVATR